MNLAYVLINTDMGSEESVTNNLNKVDEVKEVFGVYGVYDLVVRVEAETMEKLKAAISDSIRTLENVRSTLTMIVVD
jgi:DNA-binding Lrp family transcriptional regulator